MAAQPSKLRLNPFAFPPETNLRFLLLVIAAVMLAISVGQVIPTSLNNIGLDLNLGGAEVDTPRAPKDRNYQEERAHTFALSRASVVELALPVGLAIGTLALAAGIYRTYPARLRRRFKLQPLPEEKHPELAGEIRHLAQLAGVSPLPSIELGQNPRLQSGQAFGFKGAHALRLERGLYRGVLFKSRALFRAVVLHELGHIVNQDVWRSYFAQALWTAVILLVIVPVVTLIFGSLVVPRLQPLLSEGTAIDFARLLTRSLPTAVMVLVQVGVMLLVVFAIRADLLRIREIYADWRAMQGGAGAALARILGQEALKERLKGWRKVWRLHPSAKERLLALEEPARLFSVTLWLPLVVGILLAWIVGGMYPIVVPAADSISYALVGWSSVVAEAAIKSSRPLDLAHLLHRASTIASLLITFIPVFGLAYLVARTVGLQILREAVADAAYGRRGMVRYLRLWLPAALLLLGMELGFLIAPFAGLSPAGAALAEMKWVSNPIWVLPWLAAGAGVSWLAFVYARYFGWQVLGANAALTPSKWAVRVHSLLFTCLLGFFFISLLVSRQLRLYPSPEAQQTLEPVIWTSLYLGLTVYAAGFAGTWIGIMIRRASEAGRAQKSFWTRLPGILTQIAALIGAIGGLIGGLAAAGLIGGLAAPGLSDLLTIEGLPPEAEDLRQRGDTSLQQGQYPEALNYYQQALVIYREVGAREGSKILAGEGNARTDLRARQAREWEGVTLQDMGRVYASLGQDEQALENYQQALGIHREVGPRVMEGNTLQAIGFVYYDQGEYPEALNYYQQALVIYREAPSGVDWLDRVMEGSTLQAIGFVYYDQGEYPEALNYSQQALVIYREVGNRAGEGATLHTIGAVYGAQGQYDQALNYFQQALVIQRELGDRAGEGTTLPNIGWLYHSLGQYDQALENSQQALVIHREVSNRREEGNTLQNIGVVYQAQGEYDQALNYFQQALVIHRELGNRAGEEAVLANIKSLSDN
jgi:tetratricopeptide (TPR) repeat protein/Zn-dependent protease with chaperone function